MSELEKIAFANLSEIGETPIMPEDVLTIMRWAIDRRNYVSIMKHEVREAREALDELWEDEPETLISDIDNPATTRFMPSHVYAKSTEFGLKTAQLAAYDSLSNKAVATLNEKMRNHFQKYDVKIVVSGLSERLGVGTKIQTFYGVMSAEQVPYARGNVVDVGVADATLILANDIDTDFRVRLLPYYNDDQPSYLDLAVNYPAQQPAIV